MSTVKTNNVQIGQSATATNNFTWYQPASPDGTVRLGNGNAGAVTDAMTVTSAGNVGIGTTNTSNGRLSIDGVTPKIILYNSGNFNAEVGLGVFTGFGDTIGINAKQSTGLVTFGTNNTERMRIDSAGNVGIGTSAISGKLDVRGSLYVSSTASGSAPANGGYFGISDGGLAISSTGASPVEIFTNGSERMRITSDGNVGVGTAVPDVVRFRIKGVDTGTANYSFYIENSANTMLAFVRNDGAWSTGTGTSSPYNLTTGSAANLFVANGGVLYRSTSSRRYKENISDTRHGLADALKLRAVTYTGKGEADGDTIFGGLIAEEVHEAGLTEFVVYDDEGRPDALHYAPMVSLAFKAIQEQQAIIEDLRARLAALEAK